MHLAYDLLDGFDALIIVDALPGSGEPGDLTVLEVGPDDLGQGVLDGELPRTFVVGCQPFGVGDGIGLTPAVRQSVDAAVTLVTRLVGDLLAQQATAGVSFERGE
jgi:hydrogenase maturation protease